MDQRKAEKILCASYIIASLFALISSITSGITWGHWWLTLDRCIGYNCSCILYGQSTQTHFLGGSIYTCIWTSFGPVPITLTFIVFGIYHGVRSCFGPSTEATRSVVTKNESGAPIVHMQIRATEISLLPRIYWITMATITSFFAIYMLIHFSTFADGYLRSCNQYRRELIKLLNLSGTAVAVVHNRLTCNAVFDFMDYLQPVPDNIERANFINTALALITGIIGSFFATAALTLAAYINIKFARKE